MGKIFDLIADEALESSDYSDECSFCGTKGVPIYEITGFQIEPGQYLFEDVPDDWVCPECGAEKSDFEPYE